MNTELAVLQEKDLELVVSKKTLGSLTTNAKQIKELVQSALPKYDIVNYNESNIDQAKTDKAMLNKASKALNTKRLEFEKEFMKPFGEFKEVVNDVVKLIDNCSSKIDTIVKLSEQKEKESKKATIRAYWDKKEFTLVSFDKIFQENWLNKTAKEKTIFAEIDEIISKIQNDLTTLEAFDQDVELLKSMYLDKLNLADTIRYANTLKQNRERVTAAQAPKQEVVNQPAPQPFQSSFTNTPPVHSIPVPVKEEPEPSVIDDNQLLTRAFKVTASKELIIALGDFMNQNGIQFEKIEL